MSIIRILPICSTAFLLTLSFSAFAVTDLTAPGVLDRSGETYRLTQDIVADGTAFTIRGNDITLDLNGHSITYNEVASQAPAPGIFIDYLSDRIRVTNGYIVQGAGRSEQSHGIVMMGGGSVQGPSEFSYLVIRTSADATGGVHADSGNSFRNSSIHHSFIRNTGQAKTVPGDHVQGINVGSNVGGVVIRDNIIVDSHRGIGAILLGINQDSPAPSVIENNLIQVRRSAGAKAPYGIMLARSRNVTVRDNQIVSDNGRGINLDGWAQNIVRGADFNLITGNRIDVQYTLVAQGGGGYIENNVYGIRDRYSSGNNRIEFNDIIVTTTNSGLVYGAYIGSDSTDPLMVNLDINNNRIISRKGNAAANDTTVFKFDYAASIDASNNTYQTDGDVVQYHWSGTNYVDDLVMNNNQVIPDDSSVPTAPSGLSITRFLDSYLLNWDASASSNVLEYVVYRDGEQLPISPRGGRFYVDTDVSGEHTYSVTALSLEGTESSPTSTVSTSGATIGWWGVRPKPPEFE